MDSQLEKLKIRIPNDSNVFTDEDEWITVLNNLLEDSKFIGLSLRFPFEDYYEKGLPTKYNNWQIRCCTELYRLVGKENIKSYSENGLSWTRDSDYLSKSLVSEIIPMVSGFPIIEESAVEL